MNEVKKDLEISTPSYISALKSRFREMILSKKAEIVSMDVELDDAYIHGVDSMDYAAHSDLHKLRQKLQSMQDINEDFEFDLTDGLSVS